MKRTTSRAIDRAEQRRSMFDDVASLVSLVLRVRDIDAAADWYRRHLGVEVDSIVASENFRLSRFRDPDGNVLEVSQLVG